MPYNNNNNTPRSSDSTRRSSSGGGANKRQCDCRRAVLTCSLATLIAFAVVHQLTNTVALTKSIKNNNNNPGGGGLVVLETKKASKNNNSIVVVVSPPLEEKEEPLLLEQPPLLLEEEPIPKFKKCKRPCVSTCFTPAADLPNSTWPWKSAAERDEYYGRDDDDAALSNKRRRRCSYTRSKKARETKELVQHFTQACSVMKRRREQKKNNNNTTSASPTEHWPRYSLSCSDHYAGSHHLLFVPEAKLVFCGIPKVGISEWLKFFRYASGAGDYLSLPHFKEDREQFFLANLPRGKAEQLLNDPEWTRAVIFRNPAERLLSAYNDKIANSPGHFMNNAADNVGGDGKNGTGVISFSQFVDKVLDPNGNCSNSNNKQRRRGIHYCTDPHWAPQVVSCGLDALLPLFDFVGNMNHIALHTKLLLQRVGMWTKYGKNYNAFPDKKQGVCEVQPPAIVKRHNNNNETGVLLLGFNQRPPANIVHKHSTDSRSKMDLYYTPELLARVRKAYAIDYAVWDEISGRAPDDVAAGYDLAHVQEICAPATT